MLPVSFITILAGGIFWLTSMFSQVSANTSDISFLKDDAKQILIKLDDIQQRLSRIEGKLEE